MTQTQRAENGGGRRQTLTEMAKKLGRIWDCKPTAWAKKVSADRRPNSGTRLGTLVRHVFEMSGEVAYRHRDTPLVVSVGLGRVTGFQGGVGPAAHPLFFGKEREYGQSA